MLTTHKVLWISDVISLEDLPKSSSLRTHLMIRLSDGPPGDLRKYEQWCGPVVKVLYRHLRKAEFYLQRRAERGLVTRCSSPHHL